MPRHRPTRLVVSVTDVRGRTLRAGGLARWLTRSAPRRARGAVAIAVVSDEAMRALNRRHRRKGAATDVLSFPADAPAELGDIAIARGVAGRQARAHGHSLWTELRILALHGLLHLLGYDHATDRGEMRKLEDRLRRRHGLPPGLIGRAHVNGTGSR